MLGYALEKYNNIMNAHDDWRGNIDARSTCVPASGDMRVVMGS